MMHQDGSRHCWIPDFESSLAFCDRGGGARQRFVPVARMQWQDVLCVQEERVVGKDNTVAFQGLRLQLPKSRIRPHFVKAKVRVAIRWPGTPPEITVRHSQTPPLWRLVGTNYDSLLLAPSPPSSLA
jgi:hypothetical protein